MRTKVRQKARQGAAGPTSGRRTTAADPALPPPRPGADRCPDLRWDRTGAATQQSIQAQLALSHLPQPARYYQYRQPRSIQRRHPTADENTPPVRFCRTACPRLSTDRLSTGRPSEYGSSEFGSSMNRLSTRLSTQPITRGWLLSSVCERRRRPGRRPSSSGSHWRSRGTAPAEGGGGDHVILQPCTGRSGAAAVHTAQWPHAVLPLWRGSSATRGPGGGAAGAGRGGAGGAQDRHPGSLSLQPSSRSSPADAWAIHSASAARRPCLSGRRGL